MQKEYKDYIPPESGKEYALTATSTGRTKIEDVTQYAQEGASWGAADILSGCEMEFTHSKSGSVHNLTNPNANAVRGRAKMTADVAEGDTWTVNGTPVSAYMGTEDATESMAGQAYTGKWVTFVLDSNTLTFGGGSAKIPAYSTSEWVDTGEKWLDKKPVMQKVITGTFINGSYLPELTDVETLIDAHGWGKPGNTSGVKLLDTLLQFPSGGSNFSFFIGVETAGPQFSAVYNGGNASMVDAYITVKATLK